MDSKIVRLPESFTDNRNRRRWTKPTSLPNPLRKVVVLGAGMVGQACIYSMMNQGVADTYGIIDIFPNASYGNELDLEDAIASLDTHCTVRAGGYELLGGADILVITAGRPQLPGETRLQMVQENAKIMRKVADEVKAHQFHGITIVVANPCDVMTMVYLQHTGFDPRKVFSSGTLLDSSRLQFELSKTLNMKPKDMRCYILGEHGDSSITTFAHGTVGGEPIMKALERAQSDGIKTLTERCEKAHEFVYKKAYEIINRKRFTNYGIGANVAKICDSILNDQQKVMPLGVLLDGTYGEKGVVCSVICTLGRKGISSVKEFPLGSSELSKFQKSCGIMQETYLSTFEGNEEQGLSLKSHEGWTQVLN